ncbi:MAG: THUMP domain-containing class I SAM-dependent RNA methyltransferase, partial [Gemmatimonadaceae bacterium]
MTEPLQCFAVSAPGLEPLVAQELTNLGERTRVEEGGVSWEADARSMMGANLWLRTASRVVVRVAQFPATEFYELEKRAKKIDWDRFLSPGVLAEFRVTARKSKLYHSGAIAERLEKAVGSGLWALKTTSRSPQPKAQSPQPARQLFVVRVVRDVFEISADTSGELLHMRGYRQAVGKAPLRETLAAALLLAAEWNGETALVDPLCGSGTIPIEGALIARRIAPGLGRSFAFQRWPHFAASTWSRILDDAQSQALPSSPVPICGSDRDAGAIEAARSNASRAGVGGDISLEVQAISAIQRPADAGLVACNPPYGKRIGANASIRNLYAQLGNVLRARLSGWNVALFSADDRLASQVGLPFR